MNTQNITKGVKTSIYFSAVIIILLSFILFILNSNCRTTAISTGSSINPNISKNDMYPIPDEATISEPVSQEINHMWATPKTMGLIRIKETIPDIKIDLKYAGIDNFTGVNLYGEGSDAWLQPEALQKLKKAQDKLKKINPDLTLIIYDAARPQSVQARMWEVVKGTPNQSYVASPSSISLHSYGVAVDLSIWDLKNNFPLDMGTSFDSFIAASKPSLEEEMLKSGKLTQTQTDNRKLLRSIMTDAGFLGISNEWWHFNAFTRDEAKKKFKPVP